MYDSKKRGERKEKKKEKCAVGSQNKKRGGAPLGSPETYRRIIHPHHATTGCHPATMKIHKLTKHKALMIYDSKKEEREKEKKKRNVQWAVGSHKKKEGAHHSAVLKVRT